MAAVAPRHGDPAGELELLAALVGAAVRGAAECGATRQALAAVAAAAIRAARAVAVATGGGGGVQVEVDARLGLIAPVIEEGVRAAAEARRPKVTGGQRAWRNVAEHVFTDAAGVPLEVASLSKDEAGGKRLQRGRRRPRKCVDVASDVTTSVACQESGDGNTSAEVQEVLSAPSVDDVMILENTRIQQGATNNDYDSKKMEELMKKDLKAEFETPSKLLTEVLGDKAEKVAVFSRMADSSCELKPTEYDWSVNMERITKAHTLKEPMTNYAVSKINNDKQGHQFGDKTLFEVEDTILPPVTAPPHVMGAGKDKGDFNGKATGKGLRSC